MAVGRSAPRYKQMALLYPQSKSLQSHLCEYFIVVVHLCHQLLKFTQKSTFKQIASSLSDSDTKSYQSCLDLWANTIKEEINLLVAQKIEEEGQENSRYRDLSTKVSKHESLQQKIRVKLRVLDTCSVYDHETTWKQARKAGHVTLLDRNTEYRDWKGRTTSCTLIYSGKLGAGKSVLLANIVDDLHLHIGGQNITVAYFFCRHDISESLKAHTIIRSLARQLLSPISDLTKALDLLDPASVTLDFEMILRLLRHTFPPQYKAYFILDGLDECELAERDILVEYLQEIQETITLLLCVSFRLEPDSVLRSSLERLSNAKTASIPESNPDIEAFIASELKSCLTSGKLVVGDPAIILEIQNALLRKSQGMFLWVALQITSLCAMKTDDTIRHALENLPKDLSETYSRILLRSEKLGKYYQRAILELITVARRPLIAEELREALSVVPGDTNWDPAKLVNDIDSTLACCGSLIIVDEEQPTVRFIHHSVKQFLLNGTTDLTKGWVIMNDAEKRMIEIIVTYLNYGVFETQLSKRVVPQIKTGLVPSGIIRSTLSSSSMAQSLALKLLKFSKQPNYDISKILAEGASFSKSRAVNDFHFYVYANSYCLKHVIYVSKLEPVMYDLLRRLFESMAGDMDAVIEDNQEPLHWASRKGYEIIVKLLLEICQPDVDKKDESGQTPLAQAALNGHDKVVKLLLEIPQIDVNTANESGQTPLSQAARNGHYKVVKLLLETEKAMVNLRARSISHQTPLSLAARFGFDKVVKLLLETEEVDVNSKDINEKTPLIWAMERGYGRIMEQLLEDRRVNLNSKDTNGRTLLTWAAERGHEMAVRKLLKTRRVNINSKDTSGATPLSRAAGNGHETVVRELLEFDKIDVNLRDDRGWKPLSYAIANEHETVASMLLETEKADIT